ncbi:MAG TPA: hypothetical protein VK054_08110 [Beutenbergiaceae bacterium]|nr:hypothetical protein [Beutenbergiaceae bacterium]
MTKFRRPHWRDPRLVVGVVLVAFSVVLGGWIFARADQTVSVYVVTDPAAVGLNLNDATLEAIDVNLDKAQTNYFTAEELDRLMEDSSNVFLSSVQSGGLIPRSAIGNEADLSLRPISLEVSHTATLEVGQVVDLWVTSDETGAKQAQKPELVARGLHVVGLEEEDSLFGAGTAQEVEVLVGESAIADVLTAVSTRAQATLVPQSGATGG